MSNSARAEVYQALVARFYEAVSTLMEVNEGLSPDDKASAVFDAAFRVAWATAVEEGGVDPLAYVWGLRRLADTLEADIAELTKNKMQQVVGSVAESERTRADELHAFAVQALEDPVGKPFG